MRSRLMLFFSLLLVTSVAFTVSAPLASAAQDDIVVAQDSGGGGQGQDEATEETGPPWTYQMAWITLGLLVLMGIGLVSLYYRLVVKRRKSGA